MLAKLNACPVSTTTATVSEAASMSGSSTRSESRKLRNTTMSSTPIATNAMAPALSKAPTTSLPPSSSSTGASVAFGAITWTASTKRRSAFSCVRFSAGRTSMRARPSAAR